MTKGTVAVLEIGSQKITCSVALRGVNNTFVIKSFAECGYEGFSDAQFFDVASLGDACSEVIGEAGKNARTNIDSLYVGVPGEFVRTRAKEHAISYPKRRRIRNGEIDDLCSGFSLASDSDYKIIDVAAVYYVLDDNRRTANPLGTVTSKLGGYLTYFLGDKYFIKLITGICSKVGVKRVRFLSENAAESMFLFSREEREAYRILIDVGYLTTSVDVIWGNGILYHGAFSYGGGHITAGLMERLGLDFDIAEILKRKINLGFDMKAEGGYELAVNDEDYTVPLQKANMAARFCLDELSERIDCTMKECPVALPPNIPYALTGGGIAFMRGGTEYLAGRLDVPVNIVCPNVPFMDKPDESAVLGLMDAALKKSAENK